jgi:hypoxanthine phosphoribosyltransferase
MFDKKIQRKYNLVPDFKAFEVDNKFIVGFGLDHQGFYRNLDYIGYFDN